NVNDKAIVEMEYSGLDSMDLSDKIRDYKEEYRDKQDSFTEAKEEDDYALSKFDKIVDELEAKKADRDMEFLMKKEDGNWVIDNYARLLSIIINIININKSINQQIKINISPLKSNTRKNEGKEYKSVTNPPEITA